MSKKLTIFLLFFIFSSPGYSYFQSILPYKESKNNLQDQEIEYSVYGDGSGLIYSQIFKKLDYQVNLKSFQGLHRILSEIKVQTKLKRIVYFGNLSEALEKKLDPQDIKSFLKNYHDLFHSFKATNHKYSPFISSFFFKAYKSKIKLEDGRYFESTDLKEEYKEDGTTVWFTYRPLRRMSMCSKANPIAITLITIAI